MFFLQFVVIITCAQISYENAVSSATQTPDKSPLEMSIKAGLGIAMIEWDDAILSISYGTTTKKYQSMMDFQFSPLVKIQQLQCFLKNLFHIIYLNFLM